MLLLADASGWKRSHHGWEIGQLFVTPPVQRSVHTYLRTRRIVSRPIAVASLAALLLSTTARATPTPHNPGSASKQRPFRNPFGDEYAQGPTLLRAGVHIGTMHRDGVGPRLWLVPWEYVQVWASYGYRTEHSMAAGLTLAAFPRALITPYVCGGYALALTNLPYGLRMTTHQAIAGLGLEGRLHDRYFLGAELTMNTAWKATLHNKSNTIDMSPGGKYTIYHGFHLGVALP